MAGYIDFRNNGAQQGFQNALGMGLQFGAQAAEAANRKGFQNALLDYDPSKPDSWKEVAKYDPRAGMQLRRETQAQQAAQQQEQLLGAALSDDENIRRPALKQLAVKNFDLYAKLDDRQKAAIKQETEIFGGAALDVMRLPPQERPQAVLAYANKLGSAEIAGLADLPPQELDVALRTAIIEAELVKELHSMEQPREFNVGPGEGRYERDRFGNIKTIVQPNFGGAPAFSPVKEKTIGNSTYVQDENGDWYVKGGTAGNGGGGF